MNFKSDTKWGFKKKILHGGITWKPRSDTSKPTLKCYLALGYSGCALNQVTFLGLVLGESVSESNGFLASY